MARLTSPSNTPARGGKGRGKEWPAGGSARQDLANRAPSQGYSTAACSAMGEHARRRGTSRRRHLHLLHCCSFLGGAGTRRRGRREKEKERPGGATVEQLRRPASSAVATAAAVLGTERESKQRNGLGFRWARPAGLLMPRAVRSTARSGSTARSARAKIGPGGIGREAEFPAQAQVAAWARGCAGARGYAAGSWAGRAAMG